MSRVPPIKVTDRIVENNLILADSLSKLDQDDTNEPPRASRNTVQIISQIMETKFHDQTDAAFRYASKNVL